VSAVLTIAIPTYKNHEQLFHCLKSLSLYTDYNYEVLLVNNCPEDREFLDQVVKNSDFGAMRIVHAASNVGWMEAINMALYMSKTPYFCMMNDDVAFLPSHVGFWRSLVEHFDDPLVGAVGPCSNFVMGVQSLFTMGTPLQMQTSLLIGFCMVVRTQVLKDIGGLDVDLSGGDDLDLSIRLLKMGKKLICDKTVYLHHIGQQTGGRLKPNEWDSTETQEVVMNQLIRKHGIKAWYQTFTAGWDHMSKIGVAMDMESEETWLSKKLQPYKGNGFVGLNLGCGDNVVDLDDLTFVGVDKRVGDEVGVGGQKFVKAAPDLSADVMDLSLQDNSIDFIMARHLFEHLIDPLEALQEWKRVLKPGGKVLITTPNYAQSDTMIIDSSHVHAYTLTSVSNMLEAAGWMVGDCKNVGWGVIVLEGEPII
jgi:GT2 family glycosyltransferase